VGNRNENAHDGGRPGNRHPFTALPMRSPRSRATTVAVAAVVLPP
jgi:hypothetical protein